MHEQNLLRGQIIIPDRRVENIKAVDDLTEGVRSWNEETESPNVKYRFGVPHLFSRTCWIGVRLFNVFSASPLSASSSDDRHEGFSAA